MPEQAHGESLADRPAPGLAMICEQCDWRYLFPGEMAPTRCPHCFASRLSPLSGESRLPETEIPPELLLPFTLSGEELARRTRLFAEDIPFPPADLTARNLHGRLQPLWLPVWLVDAAVEADWQAEMGFNYEVVSHQDRYDENQSGWTSHEVRETRIRWEPRHGDLRREYHNVAAPALEEHARLMQFLDEFPLGEARPCSAGEVSGSVRRLPGRSHEDAWPECLPRVMDMAGDECRRAARADHVRQYRWEIRHIDRNWTYLLLPVYSTYYLDDTGAPRPLLIHGRTGRIGGERRSSMKRARRMSLLLALLALLFLGAGMVALALGRAEPTFLLAGVAGSLGGILTGLTSLIPLIRAWRFNRRQPSDFL